MAQMEDRTQLPSKLLLLSPPPSEVSSSSLRAAYAPAIAHVFKKVMSLSNQALCVIDIALTCGVVLGKGYQAPRRTIYRPLEDILAGLYRLIVQVCIENGIDLDSGSHIDPHVLFLTEDTAEPVIGHESAATYTSQGPVVTLRTLANSDRVWDEVYTMESESGELLLRSFMKLRQARVQPATSQPLRSTKVPGGTSLMFQGLASVADDSSVARRHFSVAVGGTFDHLHVGHRLLLTATALILDPPELGLRRERSITVGITGDQLLTEKKYAEILEDWNSRQKSVYQFLREIMAYDSNNGVIVQKHSGSGPNETWVQYSFHDGLVIKCVEISDPFGPTITDESISALVVSGETRSGGKAVNDKRAQKSWPALEVFEVDVLDNGSEPGTASSSDFQKKISSSEIRRKLQQKSNSVL